MKLIFIYNAKKGFKNSVFDSVHKIVSPKTYSCNLCALTHGTFGAHPKWKSFQDSLDLEIEFLHKEEYFGELKLPAILLQNPQQHILLSGKDWDQIKDLDQLIQTLQDSLRKHENSI